MLRRRRLVVIRTDESGVLTLVDVRGKVDVVVVEDQPVKRTWLDEGAREFHGGIDDSRPLVIQKPRATFDEVMQTMVAFEQYRARGK